MGLKGWDIVKANRTISYESSRKLRWENPKGTATLKVSQEKRGVKRKRSN